MNIKQISKEEDMYDVMSLLGIQPHDIFQNDLVFFVEGLSEKYVLENFMRKIYPDYDKRFVTFFPYSGIYQIEDMTIFEKMRTNYYIIVCSHKGNIDAEKRISKIQQIMKKEKLDEKLKILKKHEIENYISVLKIESEFNISLSDVKINDDTNIIKEINNKNPKFKWDSKKVLINNKLSNLMNVDEIDPEIKAMFKELMK